MIYFKPYGHLTKIGTDDFRLHLSILVADDFEITFSGTQNLSTGNTTRLTYTVVGLPGQVHGAPKEFLQYIDDVPAGNNIEILVQTHIESHELPDYIQELINDLTANPLMLGKSVLCTAGAEEGDDDREGTDEKKKSDPVDD